MILPLLLLLCFMVGCQDKEAMAELEEFRAQAAVEEQNKEIVSNYLKAWETRNFEIIKEFFAPNFQGYYPSNAEPRPLEEEKIEGMSEVHLEVAELLAVADRVIARGVVHATPEAEYQAKYDIKKIEYSWITMFQIEDGKIVEIREEVDMLGFVTQLGMELKPKEEEK
jgi:predicted ester cyclase